MSVAPILNLGLLQDLDTMIINCSISTMYMSHLLRKSRPRKRRRQRHTLFRPNYSARMGRRSALSIDIAQQGDGPSRPHSLRSYCQLMHNIVATERLTERGPAAFTTHIYTSYAIKCLRRTALFTEIFHNIKVSLSWFSKRTMRHLVACPPSSMRCAALSSHPHPERARLPCPEEDT